MDFKIGKRLVLATGNRGKVKEIQAILGGLDLEVVPQTQFNVSNAEETGLSFVENAIIKARHAAKATGLPALADDSGLEIDALKGGPGIYSARYAGPNASDDANNQLVLAHLKETPEQERTARFHCVIVVMRHALDPMPVICQGTWEGSILPSPRGNHGFGYDPLFYVPTHRCSAAELPVEVKSTISHRGQALTQLGQFLRKGH